MSEERLQVMDWNGSFEGAKSRTYNNKTQCSMPCRHGLGYRRLIRRKDGAALFGAWCALVQVLSRHNKPRDGWVTDDGTPDGTPYSCEDLEFLTDIPAKVFAALFKAAKTRQVGWVKSQPDRRLRESTDTTRIQQETIVPLNSNSNSNLDSNSNTDTRACAHGELFDPQPQPPEQEPDTKAPDAALQATFDEARKAYPGITRGMPTEWANFKKKHKADYRQAAAELLPAIEAQAASRERKKQVGDFCPDWPHFATWINNRRWEDQVPVAPAAKRKPLATW